MSRLSFYCGVAAVCAFTAVSCSQSAQTPVSPTGAAATDGALNPDGSSLKITRPSGLSPDGNVTLDTLRPTLSFTNSTGVFSNARVGLTYDVQIVTEADALVYSRTIDEFASAPSTAHTLEADLVYATTYFFRVRGHLGADVGPWSNYARFRTPPPPCAVITLSPPTLPNGTVGVAYSQTIVGNGGTTPYTFAVTAGSLPAGLTLAPTGVLSGTPTAAGSSPVTIRGTDANGCSGSVVYTIVTTATPLPPSQGGLPFPIPASCGAFGAGNRIQCVADVAALSTEWTQGCARGVGTRCHRFARQVVFALHASDPNWKMIQAAPGGNACNCSDCGPSDGTMFREDTTVYGGNSVFDMIVGAGGATPSLNWSLVPGPRAGDIPADAPLCVP